MPIANPDCPQLQRIVRLRNERRFGISGTQSVAPTMNAEGPQLLQLTVENVPLVHVRDADEKHDKSGQLERFLPFTITTNCIAYTPINRNNAGQNLVARQASTGPISQQ